MGGCEGWGGDRGEGHIVMLQMSEIAIVSI